MSDSRLESFQQAFADWLLGNERTEVEQLIARKGLAPSARLQVYRNLVLGNFTDALATAYPMLQKLVGEDFFEAVCSAYIRDYPSTGGNLQDYGRHLGELLTSLPQAEDFPYLPDVARLEWARQESALAPLAAPLPPSALALLPADDVEHLCLTLSPPLRLVQSIWPVLDIWLFCQDPQDRTLSIDGGGQQVAVWRKGEQIAMQAVDATWYAFARQLQQALPLGEAHQAACRETPDFDPSACLRWLFAEGLVTETQSQ